MRFKCLNWIYSVFSMSIVFFPTMSWALECSAPPAGLGSSWAYEYRDWCIQCGGIFHEGPSCEPGPDWGGNQDQSGPNTPQQSQSQRQEEDEAQKKRRKELAAKQASEKRIKQQQFEEIKNKTLKMLKGVNTADDQLKGTIHEDSSVVDLRHLDLKKPVRVDPHLVKGGRHQIPIQVSDKTLENQNYIKGFEAIKSGQPSEAIQFFKTALSEIPGDLLIQNALSLAEDLAKTRDTKKKQEQALSEAYKGLYLAHDGDFINGVKHLETAVKLSPGDEGFKNALTSIKKMKEAAALRLHLEEKTANKERAFIQMGSSAIIAIRNEDFDSAQIILNKMQIQEPNNKSLKELTQQVKIWKSKPKVKIK